jgi:uncharacterized protein (DUF697 family)/tellurite resistance protein
MAGAGQSARDAFGISGLGSVSIASCTQLACAQLEQVMQPSEPQAILTIALLAAFADGTTDDRERDAIRRIAESLAHEHGAPDLARVYQDVLLKRVNLQQTARLLREPAHRQLAYEMAVCACDADAARSPAERQFLRQLQEALGLEAAQVSTVEQQADAIAAAPLASAAATSLTGLSPAIDAELDRYILNHAIVNGAIELLPESLASMAIIPLQIKMVYRIGQRYGHELDKGHIREFIAAAGVGITSQYLEQAGRKLFGGLLGTIAGGLGRGLGSAATGMAFSFATTYALGQLAKRYYASGRQMSAALLQSTYQSLLGEAKQLQQQNLAQIRDKARTLDVAQVMSAIRQ